MKKILSQIILLAASLLLVIPGTLKTIKIGCVNDYYPYINTKENGELEGIIIDLWTLWSEKTERSSRFDIVFKNIYLFIK